MNESNKGIDVWDYWTDETNNKAYCIGTINNILYLAEGTIDYNREEDNPWKKE
jgi:hypothetical protein